MDNIASQIQEIKFHLVETLANKLESKELSLVDFKDAAQYISMYYTSIDSEEKLILFLQELSKKWKVFEAVLHLETERIKKGKEEKIAANITELAKSGNIDAALQAARDAIPDASS